VIYSDQELKGIVDKFEVQKALPGKHLGERTLWIDFKILGGYKTSHVLQLLHCTPNLLTYNNRNGPANSPEHCTPPEVMKGLGAVCSRSLRRLEWSGATEGPRYQDLIHLCCTMDSTWRDRFNTVITVTQAQKTVGQVTMYFNDNISIKYLVQWISRAPLGEQVHFKIYILWCIGNAEDLIFSGWWMRRHIKRDVQKRFILNLDSLSPNVCA